MHSARSAGKPTLEQWLSGWLITALIAAQLVAGLAVFLSWRYDTYAREAEELEKRAEQIEREQN